MRESIPNNVIRSTERIMDGIVLNTSSGNILTNVSSGAYYGYQPQVHMQRKHFIEDISFNSVEDANQNFSNEKCNMDVTQFAKSEYLEPERDTITYANNRKRHWVRDDESVETKKSRQNDNPSCSTSEQVNQVQIPPVQKIVHLRKPTHNIPDLPRCIMEYNKDNQKNATREDEERKVLEDILKETHGVSIYHWFCNEA